MTAIRAGLVISGSGGGPAEACLTRDRFGSSRENPIATWKVARVPVRMPLEIILMLGLSFPERPGRRHLGDDPPRPEARRFNVGDRVVGDPALFLVVIEDRRAVARPDVVALTVQCRRIVDLEEELQQVSIRDLLRVEGDLDRLGVRAVVAVRRVRDVAAGVAHPRRPNALSFPDEILHAPEAAAGKDRLLDSVHVPPPPRSTSRRSSLYPSASTHRLSRQTRDVSAIACPASAPRAVHERPADAPGATASPCVAGEVRPSLCGSWRRCPARGGVAAAAGFVATAELRPGPASRP